MVAVNQKVLREANNPDLAFTSVSRFIRNYQLPDQRKIRKKNTATKNRLIDAARSIMIEEGYAAVTSRKVASRVGVKAQLIYYHFSTMEDLLIAVLQHAFDEILIDYTRSFTSKNPLKSLWEHCFRHESAVLTVEFMALANHREPFGKELVRFGNQIRSMQEQLFSQILDQHNINQKEIPPVTLSLLLLSLSHTMGVEANWGLTRGHEETLSLLNRVIEKYELSPNKERSNMPPRHEL